MERNTKSLINVQTSHIERKFNSADSASSAGYPTGPSSPVPHVKKEQKEKNDRKEYASHLGRLLQQLARKPLQIVDIYSQLTP